MTDSSILNTLQASMLAATAAGKETIECGPFCAFLSSHSEAPWMNYAIPVAEPATTSDIAALQDVFRSRERILRIEMIETLWPSLSDLFESMGFELQMRIPMMTCTKETFIPATSHSSVQTLTTEDDPVPYMTAGGLAFSDASPITDARISSWKNLMHTGHFQCAQALVDSVVAGVGCLMPYHGAAELAGIGTIPDYRRRGIASAISSTLMENLWSQSNEEWIVWLSASDDQAKAVYEKLGFVEVGTQENWQARS